MDSFPRKRVAFLGALLLLFGAYFQFWYSPTLAEIRGREEMISNLQNRLEENRIVASNLDSFRLEVEEKCGLKLPKSDIKVIEVPKSLTDPVPRFEPSIFDLKKIYERRIYLTFLEPEITQAIRAHESVIFEVDRLKRQARACRK